MNLGLGTQYVDTVFDSRRSYKPVYDNIIYLVRATALLKGNTLLSWVRGLIIRQFIEQTTYQFTYYGLFFACTTVLVFVSNMLPAPITLS